MFKALAVRRQVRTNLMFKRLLIILKNLGDFVSILDIETLSVLCFVARRKRIPCFRLLEIASCLVEQLKRGISTGIYLGRGKHFRLVVKPHWIRTVCVFTREVSVRDRAMDSATSLCSHELPSISPPPVRCPLYPQGKFIQTFPGEDRGSLVGMTHLRVLVRK